MKLTGPDAVPPPFRCSALLRMFDKLIPDPEPPLKIVPSSLYQFKIASIVSSTAKIKQALACCGTPSTPMLNHTGELNAARCVTKIYFNSSRKESVSVWSTKYPHSDPHLVIVSATRSITWRIEFSRSGVPGVPLKYFCETMFVEFNDHVVGNSTPSCSNATVPSFQFLI